MTDRVGQQLGNYRLVRLLGRGGFAEVYLGEHIHLGTEAAIKVLHTQIASEDVEQFRTEARLIARLIHPHIVRVLDFGLEGDATPYLVMDYASGGTLRKRHPKGTCLPIQMVVSYVQQIAPALQYAHDRKLIHRDIKPENLLIGRSNEILLSDFGIALVAQSSRYQSTRDMAGTIAYMAPEQIEAHPRPASDQYSLGIVVYEWLSGDRPFHGSFTEIAIKHSVVPPPPLREKVPTLSAAVEQVVMTAIAKDPRQRFASVKAFANALEQASRLEASSTTTPDRSSQSTNAVALINEIQQSTKQATFPIQTSLPNEAISSSGQSFITTELIAPVDRPAIAKESSSRTSQAYPPTEAALLPKSLMGSPNEVIPPRRGISRRAAIVSLVVAAVVIAGLVWLARSQAASPTPGSVKLKPSPTLASPTSTGIKLKAFYTGSRTPIHASQRPDNPTLRINSQNEQGNISATITYYGNTPVACQGTLQGRQIVLRCVYSSSSTMDFQGTVELDGHIGGKETWTDGATFEDSFVAF